QHIHNRREYFLLTCVECFDDNTNDATRPHESKNRPANPTSKYRKAKRCVCARDQQIDRHMVEFPRQLLNPWRLNAMIQCRGEIQQHQCAAEHGKGYNMPYVAFYAGENDEEN